MRRVLRLPAKGTLLAVTDLHGNLADFRAVVARFNDLLDSGSEPHLLFCGDLPHGPAIAETDWPDHLGAFYQDQTPRLLAEAQRLQATHPARVHFLLGNHEHAHLGGPKLAKFHPDEAANLEMQYPVGGFEPIRSWWAGWPIAAVAPVAGIAFTHAAPHARITSAADLDRITLTGHESRPPHEMTEAGSLGALLWARTTTAERAFAFLHALDRTCRVAVFGHDVVREGHLIEHEPLLCVSSSFGCHDGDKVYLEWDLARPAPSAAVVATEGLRPVHPQARPVYRPDNDIAAP